MTHLIVLLMVVAVGASSGPAETVGWLPSWAQDALGVAQEHVVLTTLTGFAALLLPCWGEVARCSRRMDRTGRAKWVRRADRALLLMQWGVLGWRAVAGYGRGGLGAVRAATGDTGALDEGLALAPAVVALTLLWLVFWPVERRIREAMQFNRLDAGEPVHPIGGRWTYTSDQLRTHAGPTLIAAMLLFGWIECVDLLSPRFTEGLGSSGDAVTGVVLGAGAVAIVAVLPVVWRLVWRTRRLPEGALRDELDALCARHNVRVGDLLVWETRGVLLNGALVGVVPRLRYILLTDALLERLAARQVEAVLAHEIAHAKHRHIPWLIATVLISVGLISSVVSLVIAEAAALPAGWETWVAGGASIVGAGLMLGMVSRRFEQQADAFAAQHLALARTGEPDPTIEAGDAQGMMGALEAVARFNHIPPAKRSFRHGSIRARQRRLQRLVGARRSSVPVDGFVRWLKRSVLVAGAVMGLLLWRFPEAGALL